MSEKPKIDLAITIIEDAIRLSFLRRSEELLWVELKPSQAQHWADTLNHAVEVWEKGMMKNGYQG